MTDVQEHIKKLEDFIDTGIKARKDFDDRIRAIEEDVKGTILKAQRPNIFSGGADLGAVDKKGFDLGARALLSGDLVTAQRHFSEAKAMTVGTDPAGGYWVMPEMSLNVTRVMLETSPLLKYVRVVDLGPSDEFHEIIDKDEAGVTWVGEQDSRPETDSPDLGELSVPLHEVYASPKVSQKLIDTASNNVGTWLIEKVGEKFGHSFGASIIDGNGTSRPFGFTTYTAVSTADATRAWGQLQYVPTGASGAFASSNPTDVLDDAIAALKPQYRREAVWVMNRSTAATLRKLKDSTGTSLWQPSLVAGTPSMLKGYPVIEDDQMPSISAGAPAIAFGNFRKGYVFIRRNGFRFLADPYTAKPNVLFYCYQRVGGVVSNFEAIKLVKFSAS